MCQNVDAIFCNTCQQMVTDSGRVTFPSLFEMYLSLINDKSTTLAFKVSSCNMKIVDTIVCDDFVTLWYKYSNS